MTQATTTPASPAVEVDGAAVRELRKQLGDTISALAPRVPMSIGFLSQIERGTRTRVSPPKFKALAAALGIADNPDAIKRSAA
ncbi:helix-turn-helix domain-containing protein [Dactylosporangium sp. NPDC000521]|uniref:helix-turn-helix domain-containing protein n=1 Tax=Dactylosporangium sp. NPDC000521 TaxID=3363975 RepID=UPI0036A4237E